MNADQEKQSFFVRIHPARLNFMRTMTEQERAVMRAHYAYWKARLSERVLILAGPIPIPDAPFGIIILRACDAEEAEQLMRGDPSVIANVTDYEIFPLRLSLYEGRPTGTKPNSD
jgi:uncharacterized protein YciI